MSSTRTLAASMPSPSAAWATPPIAMVATAANARLCSMRIPEIPGGVSFATSRMGRHPIRQRPRFFLAEPRVRNQEREECEIDDQPEAAERILDRGHVGIGAEPFRNLLGGDTGADCAEHDERQREEAERDLVG